jgi:hypothetical protein
VAPADDRSIGDIQKVIDDILDGCEVPDERLPPPRITAEDDRSPLSRVVEGLGSTDAGTRAAAGAAVDTFLKSVGLGWKDIADAIGVMSAVENWKAEWRDRAPRRDTGWTSFVDREDRFGFGRWFNGRALTVRVCEHAGSSWFAAMNGHVIRDLNRKPRLFRDPDRAKAVIEAFAGESK